MEDLLSQQLSSMQYNTVNYSPHVVHLDPQNLFALKMEVCTL